MTMTGRRTMRRGHTDPDREVAERLRRHVYAAGNAVEPNAAFAAFRGRAPRLEPLLAKRGLLEEAAPA